MNKQTKTLIYILANLDEALTDIKGKRPSQDVVDTLHASVLDTRNTIAEMVGAKMVFGE